MSNELKDRKGYTTDEAEKRKEFREQVEKQAITVTDKRKTAETAGTLRQEGTRDGAARVRKAMELAGQAVDHQMNQQRGEHDAKATHGKKVEHQVGKASDSSGQDSKAASAASRAVDCKGAQAALHEAERAASEDQKWLSELRSRRHRDRESSEKKTRQQVDEVKKTLVKTVR